MSGPVTCQVVLCKLIHGYDGIIAWKILSLEGNREQSLFRFLLPSHVHSHARRICHFQTLESLFQKCSGLSPPSNGHYLAAEMAGTLLTKCQNQKINLVVLNWPRNWIQFSAWSWYVFNRFSQGSLSLLLEVCLVTGILWIGIWHILFWFHISSTHVACSHVFPVFPHSLKIC